MRFYHRRKLLATIGTIVAGCSAPSQERENPNTSSSPDGSAPEWPTVGYDIANTGYIPERIQMENISEAWRSSLDNRSDILAAPVVNKHVYAGSGQTIYAISLESGSKLWEIKTSYDTGIVSAAITDELLMMSGLAIDGGNLFGIYADSGRIKWVYKAPVSTAPKVAGGKVFIGTSDPKRALVALNVSSGDVAWTKSFGPDQSVDTLRTSPAIHDKIVFLAATKKKRKRSVTLLQAISTDGEDVWEFEVPGKINSAPAVDGRSIYFGTTDETVYAVETKRGKTRWARDVSGKVYSSPAIDPNTLYLGTVSGHLYALRKENGEKQWHNRKNILYTDPVVTAGTVYTGGKAISAHDTEQGRAQWEFNMDSKAHAEFTSPTVLDDGILFGACTKKQISQTQYGNYVLMLRSDD